MTRTLKQGLKRKFIICAEKADKINVFDENGKRPLMRSVKFSFLTAFSKYQNMLLLRNFTELC